MYGIPKYPYAGRRAQISRAHISHPILALAFLLWNLIDNYLDIGNAAESLREDILDRCQQVERTVNIALTFPKQIAVEINDANVKWINRSIQGLVNILCSGIELLGHLLVFAFNSFESILRCLVESVVDSGLALLARYSKDIQQAVQTAVSNAIMSTNAITRGIQTTVNNVANFFTGGQQPTPVSIPEIGPVTVPDTLQQGLESLKQYNVAFLGDLIDEWLMKPFKMASDALQDVANDTLLVRNATIIPVDSIRTLSVQFCDRDNNTIFGQDLGFIEVADVLMHRIILICIGLVCGAIVGVILFRQFHVRWRYGRQQTHINVIQNSMGQHPHVLLSNGSDNLNLLNYELSNPTKSKFGRWLSHTNRGDLLMDMYDASPEQRISWRKRWFADYIAHGPSLIMISTGILGIVFCIMQLETVRQVRTTVIPVLQQDISRMASKMVTYVNNQVDKRVDEFINGTNYALIAVESDVNGKVFKPMSDVVSTINGTMNHVLDEAEKFLTETLHLDVLGDLVDKLFNCLIRMRLRGLEQLFSIIEGMGIRLPRIDPDLFRISPQKVSEEIDRLNLYLFGPNGDGIGGKVGIILAKLEKRIRRQMIFYGITMAFGMSIMLQGLIGVLWLRFRPYSPPVARGGFQLPISSDTKMID